MQRTVFLALGSNICGHFGNPVRSLRQSVSCLSRYGILLVRCSSVYRTTPLGGGKQSTYFNAVVEARTHHAARSLLHILKRIETEFGRRRNGLNRPRPLDIDIIDATWPVVGWQVRKKCRSRLADLGRHQTSKLNRTRKRATVMLPHPEVHRRRFVLEPLLEISPQWYHRALRCTGRQLLARLPRRPHEVERTLDSLLHS
jgi:2-amino-4-hydroxy-6-hydroxymethyldihydropteridine diphosphokinase